MRFRTTAATGTLLAGAMSVGALFLVASPASASAEDPQFVTMCHATGSSTNPYVMITLDVAGPFHAHLQHDGDHPGEDIIPPFTYREETYQSPNWAQYAEAWDVPAEADGSTWLREHGPEYGCLPSGEGNLPAEELPATSADADTPATPAGIPLRDRAPAGPAGIPLPDGAPATSAPGDTPATPDGIPLPAGAPASPDGIPLPDGAPAAPSVAAAASDEAPVARDGDDGAPDEESAASDVPAGAVAAGDGSSAGEGIRVLPYVLGGAALTAAGGAAFAARRSARASG